VIAVADAYFSRVCTGKEKRAAPPRVLSLPSALPTDNNNEVILARTEDIDENGG